MTIQNNIHSIYKKWILCTLCLMLCTYAASAQGSLNQYLGFGASFGVRHQPLKSNITALDNMVNLQEGGSLMVIAGTRIVRAKIETGFYYSAPSVPRTVDAIEMGAVVNFYPLQAFFKNESRLQPYTVAGVTRAQNKFYGFYSIDDNSSTSVNYSVSQEPYLGKSVVLQSTYGLGIEYHLSDHYNFIHLFAEARQNKPFDFNSTREFEHTRFNKSLAINIGVVFGLKKGARY